MTGVICEQSLMQEGAEKSLKTRLGREGFKNKLVQLDAVGCGRMLIVGKPNIFTIKVKGKKFQMTYSLPFK